MKRLQTTFMTAFMFGLIGAMFFAVFEGMCFLNSVLLESKSYETKLVWVPCIAFGETIFIASVVTSLIEMWRGRKRR